jgi:hypothetical protein
VVATKPATISAVHTELVSLLNLIRLLLSLLSG